MWLCGCFLIGDFGNKWYLRWVPAATVRHSLAWCVGFLAAKRFSRGVVIDWTWWKGMWVLDVDVWMWRCDLFLILVSNFYQFLVIVN